jgi:hypothetical protein
MLAISWMGNHGVGKGVIPVWFRQRVLGEAITATTGDPENDLVGRFATKAVGKIFLQIDELKTMHAFSEKLKIIVTDEELRSEVKCQQAGHKTNYINLFFTSNNENTLPVEPGDRRFAIFQCNPIHMGDAEYFHNLRAHIAKPEVVRAYYEFLLGRDLSKYAKGFAAFRPETEYYVSMRDANIPPLARFLGAIINSGIYGKTVDFIPVQKFFEMFKDYVKKNGLEKLNQVTCTIGFGREACAFEGVARTKTGGNRGYSIDIETLKACLIKTNRFAKHDDSVL